MTHAHSYPLFRLFACKAVVLVAFAGIAGQSVAQVPRQQPVGFTWGELALLPEYCKDTNGTVYGGPGGDQSPRAKHWVALMGEDFWHMHHYCYGLKNMMQAGMGVTSPAQSRALIGRAINEYGYIVKNARMTMPLMPEVFLKMGEAHLRLGNLVGAKDAFEASRQAKPDYWPAYTAWIDELLKLKQTSEAKSLAMKGLAHAPTSTELLARLRRIDPKAKPPALAASAGLEATTAAAPPAASTPPPRP